VRDEGMNDATRNHPFYRRLDERILELGGMFNAHLHLDRAGTLEERYMASTGQALDECSHVSLAKKHGLIGRLHEGPAYEAADLERRVHSYLDTMVAARTARADTLVDVTDDRVGLSALETLEEVRRERAGDIDLRLAAYSPLGFRDSEPGRWELFEEGARRSDFIASLPEADDTDDYPGNIGFDEHCRRVLALSRELGKMVHIHTDQRNEPTERGTERLIAALREHGAPVSPDSNRGEPLVWAVHAISPSTYDEARFDALLAGLVETGIGVVCCPSAAMGMRQIRPLTTPTHNSIPRVLEMLAAGVHVRVGSDNVADMCSPSTTADLRDEIFVLSGALRFYHVGVLARLAAGQRLDAAERELVSEHLARDRAEIERALGRR